MIKENIIFNSRKTTDAWDQLSTQESMTQKVIWIFARGNTGWYFVPIDRATISFSFAPKSQHRLLPYLIAVKCNPFVFARFSFKTKEPTCNSCAALLPWVPSPALHARLGLTHRGQVIRGQALIALASLAPAGLSVAPVLLFFINSIPAKAHIRLFTITRGETGGTWNIWTALREADGKETS